MILSGINAGSNTGDDVNLSGTLGAAFMGLMLGIPSIALSQVCETRKTARWDTARAITPHLLRHFLDKGWSRDTCLSINIPDLPANKITGFAWARQGMNTTARVIVDQREDLREQTYFWMTLHDKDPTTQGGDENAVLRNGQASVTALSLNRSIEVKQPPVSFAKAANE
jgi:5'-nucleotidase